MMHAIAAAHKWRKGEWHHVRVEASKSSARFWVDGQPVGVTRQETDALLSSNAEPVRVGGHRVPWAHATWFNGSIIGEVSDVEVVVL